MPFMESIRKRGQHVQVSVIGQGDWFLEEVWIEVNLVAVLVLAHQNASEKISLRLPISFVSAAAHPPVRNTTNQELLPGWGQLNKPEKGGALKLNVCD